MQECRSKFLSYLEEKSLNHPEEKQYFLLDNNLCKIWRGKQLGSKIEKKEIPQKLETNLKKFSSFINGDRQFFLKNVPKIEISIFKKASNRLVTQVYGLSEFGYDEKQVCSAFQIIFATSCSLQTFQNKNIILILGDVSDKIKTVLENDFHIPLQYVTITKEFNKRKK